MIVYQIQHHGIFHLRHIMSEKQSLELSNATENFITVILIDQGIASHAILRIFKMSSAPFYDTQQEEFFVIIIHFLLLQHHDEFVEFLSRLFYFIVVEQYTNKQ